MEVSGTLNEIKTALSNVAHWAAPARAPFSFNYFAMRPTLRKEPKGVVLVVVPFNYPLLLSVGPLVRYRLWSPSPH
jgi:aldehyde dehydrogenase (NAD+)